jgi:hypothetical protein
MRRRRIWNQPNQFSAAGSFPDSVATDAAPPIRLLLNWKPGGN